MFTGKSKERTTTQARYRVLRTVAGVTATSMAWLIAGPSVAAGVQVARAAKPQGHTRTLNQTEMARIFGAQGSGPLEPPMGEDSLHHPSTTPSSGGTYPWEGNYNETNTGNGNKQTELPIVSWKARGGRLGVNLSLVHNSQGNHNSELGHKWTHSYDIYLMPDGSNGDMTVHWGDDLSYTFYEQINGSFDAPTGIHDTFVKTGSNTSATYDLTTKDQIVYHFAYIGTSASAGAWYCTSITDRNGNALTIAHNSAGLVTSVTDPTSRALTFSYTSGKLTGITDPIARSWTLHYDSNDDLTSVDLPAVGSTTYSMGYGYSASHNITSVTDLRGKVWTNSYYIDNAVEWEKDPLGNKTSYVYTANFTKITDANGHFIKHNYSSGNLSSVQDGAGQIESYSYDTGNNKTGITDKRGKLWNCTFDSMGNCLTETDPLLHTTTYTFNARNDMTSIETELGYEANFVYSVAGNLASETDQLMHSITYGYDSYGQVTTVTDALGQTTITGHDTDGNVISVTDAMNHSTSSVYDGIGRQTGVTDATSKTTSSTYDELNRVTSVTTPGSRTTTFNYSGGSDLKTSETNPLSHTNSYSYDDAGRVISHTDPNIHTVYVGYDYAGNKTSFTDANAHTTYYSYTNRDELSGIVYPDNTSQSYTYNANGDLNTKTDGRGVTATNAYDNANRLIGTSYNDGMTASVSFCYDDDDRKSGMSDGTGTYTYSYDAASRLTQRATPNLTVSFSYDVADRMTIRTLGTGSTTFSYDNANRVTSLSAPGASASETTSYTYDDAGRNLTVTLANGDVETKGYSSTTAELTSVLHQNGATATISSHVYTYRADGRKTSETLADGSVINYGYDSKGQLTSQNKVNSSSVSVYNQSYTYDAAGNRASKTVGSIVEYYTYDDANKMTASGDKTYTYDDAGNAKSITNTTTSVTTDLTWDGESRLTSIYGGTSVSEAYVFNGLDQRIGKVDSASNTFAYTHEDDEVDSPVLSDGTANYTHGIGLVSEVRNATSKFYHADGLGSTRAITSAIGTTTDTHETDAFGNTVSASGTTPTPFGFVGGAGYQTDGDTGLMLLGHRYYDASVGRFLSRDPIQAGYNWYAYCENDPVNDIDPNGCFSLREWIRDTVVRYIWPKAGPTVTPNPPPSPPRPFIPPPGPGRSSDPKPLPPGAQERIDRDSRLGQEEARARLEEKYGNPPGFRPGMRRIPPGGPGNLGGGGGRPGGGGGRPGGGGGRPGGGGSGGPRLGGGGGGGGGFGGGGGGGFGGGGGGCFIAGTPVTMADGSTKPIEQIQSGDMVLSCDPVSGKVESQPVVDAFVHEVDDPLLKLSFSNGDTVITTAVHRFYVPEIGFISAAQLSVGMDEIDPLGSAVRLTQVQVPARKHTKVYNFTVAEFHTYYVGTRGILVHNSKRGQYDNDPTTN